MSGCELKIDNISMPNSISSRSALFHQNIPTKWQESYIIKGDTLHRRTYTSLKLIKLMVLENVLEVLIKKREDIQGIHFVGLQAGGGQQTQVENLRLAPEEVTELAMRSY